MIDASSKTARAIATGAVFAAAIVHSTMSATFGWSLGGHDAERYLFAGFSVAVDICKVFALAFAALAFERGRWAKGACCILVWATTVTYSGAAALGFAALSRDTVVASRTSHVDDYAYNAAEKKRLTAQMEAGRSNPLFAETYGCTEYSRSATKGEARKKAEFCSAYWRAAAALDDIKPQIKSAALTDADPQTALMAKISGYPREVVAVGLAIFLAIVAEIVSALGTFVFSSSRRKPDRRERKERVPSKPKLVVSN